MFGWDYKDSEKLFEQIAAVNDETIANMLEKAGVGKYIVLSTCNRFEVYYDGDGDTAVLPFRPQRELSGREAVRHLFMVSSGLESLSLGENEILGQIKDSYEKSLESGTVTNLLSNVARKSISCGKNVRHKTGISAGRVSVPSYCGQLIYSRFRGNGKRISVIGTGKMSNDILKYVMEGKPASVTVYGRRQEALARLQDKFRLLNTSFMKDLSSVVEESDIIVFATTSKKPLLFSSDFSVNGTGKAIMDVSVPTNVDKSVDSLENVTVVRLSDIEPVLKKNMEWKRKLVDEAEKIVDSQTDVMMKKILELESEDLISRIYSFSRKIGEQEAEEFRRSISSGQDIESSIEGFVNSIVNKLLHPQTAAIKDLVRNGGAGEILDRLVRHYETGERVSVSDYSEPEGREGSRNRRAQIHR